jgi:flagellar biosynthesis GTPase FlhF
MRKYKVSVSEDIICRIIKKKLSDQTRILDTQEVKKYV